MLRAHFRRRFKDNTSGIEIQHQVYSIPFENPEIEKELRAGGFGETGFEVRELIGVEVEESPSPVPKEAAAPKPKDPQPESVQQGLLDAITLIAFESGYRMSDEERVIAIQRLTMRWREKFENMSPLMIEHFLQGVMLILEQLRREQEAAVHAAIDESDA